MTGVAIGMVPASYWARQSETANFSRRLERDALRNAILDRDGGALPVRVVLLAGRADRRGVSADFKPHPRSGECRRAAALGPPLSKIGGPVRVDARTKRQGRRPRFRGRVLPSDETARASVRPVRALRVKLERARTTALCAVRRRADRPPPGSEPRASGFPAFLLKA